MNSVAINLRIPAETGTKFYCMASVVFVSSVVATIYFCRSMAGGMDMPGGWTMSMAWMRMPGQSWSVTAAMFMAMWLAMMVAMMLPSALPMLSQARRPFWMGLGYFGVWELVGLPIFLIGVLFASATMRWESLSRLVPPLAGTALLLGGAFQFSPWKKAGLTRCRCWLSDASNDPWRAFQQGCRFGVACMVCCIGLMMTLLILGMMNLYVLATVMLGIASERLFPKPERTSRVLGIAAMCAGVFFLINK